jgi:hypothetical protein
MTMGMTNMRKVVIATQHPLAPLWNKYRFNVKRLSELSEALPSSKYEDKFIVDDDKGESLFKVYSALSGYIGSPCRQNRLKTSNVINAAWHNIPRELKSKGSAFRIWIFNSTYAKRAYVNLTKTGSMTVRPTEFLSFTDANPLSDKVFQKYWTVFNGQVSDEGGLILIQKQEYQKGFSITKYMKYLLDKGFLVEEDSLDDDMTFESLDTDVVGMMNKEQEILVFDDVLKIDKADILGIKVSVPREVDLPGLVIPIVKTRFVTVKTLQEALPLLKEYNPTFH